MAVAEKFVAPESEKTKKTRLKLMKQWESEKVQITPIALKNTVEKIHKWIADNAKYRVSVRKKSIRLFNQNKDAAKISKRVQSLAKRLHQMEHFSEDRIL